MRHSAGVTTFERSLGRLLDRVGGLSPRLERWDIDVWALGAREGDRLVFIAPNRTDSARFDLSFEPGPDRLEGAEFETTVERVREQLTLSTALR